jgi:hypothetical protein
MLCSSLSVLPRAAPPATSPRPADSGDALPLPHDLCSGAAYNRVNLPWFHFGTDFGTTVWGDLGIAHNPQAEPKLDQLQQLGVEDVITWTIPDGRNVTFTADGTPSGLAPNFARDLTAWLDMLAEREMSAELVLIDGNTWFKPQTTSGGLTFRGHGDVVMDRSGRKQAAFDRCVVLPMLQTIQAWQQAHPGEALPVSGINLGNELLYGVNADRAHPDKNVPSVQNMRDFVRGRADFIHRHMPDMPLTLGAVSADDLFENWMHLEDSQGDALDYLTFHHYDSEPMASVADRLPWWAHADRRVHLGEFPGRRGAPLAEYLEPVAGWRGDEERSWFPDRFLASAAMWASRPTDPYAPANPEREMSAIQEWFGREFRIP